MNGPVVTSGAPRKGQALGRAAAYIVALTVYMFIGSLIVTGLLAGITHTDLEELGEGRNGTMLLLLTVIVFAGSFALTHFFLRKVDRVSWRVLFPPTRRGRDIIAGYVLAAIFLGILLATMALAGWLRFEGEGELPQRGALSSIVLIVLLGAGFLVQGGAEEVICRGYLLRNFHLGVGFVVALLVTSVIFGIAHGLNPGAGLPAFLNVFAIGAFLVLLVVRRSLWTAVGMHAGWNLFMALAGVPVSGISVPGIARADLTGPVLWTGGKFGPEGSVLTFLLAAAGCVVLLILPGLKAALERTRLRHSGQAQDQRGDSWRPPPQHPGSTAYNYYRTPEPPDESPAGHTGRD